MVDWQCHVETIALERIGGIHQELVLLRRLPVWRVRPEVHEAEFLRRNQLPLIVEPLRAVSLAASESTRTPN